MVVGQGRGQDRQTHWQKQLEPSEQGGEWPQLRLASKAGARLYLTRQGHGERSPLYPKEVGNNITQF